MLTRMTWIAVDWGTSALRAALLRPGAAVEERAGGPGILAVAAGGFPAALAAFCGDWRAQYPGARVLISGMAGSAQGWALAPYCPCPAPLAQLASQVLWLEPGQLGLVPGLCDTQGPCPDVMRGEEVQVLGAMALAGAHTARVVLPGTHSKWVRLEAGVITGFETFMTGEMFALLRQHSILARTLPAMDADAPWHPEAFAAGLTAAAEGSVLHHAFGVRTQALFEQRAPEAMPDYLSGLLIGEELRAQAFTPGESVWVVGAPALQQRYAHALRLRGLDVRCFGAEATWHGLQAVAHAIEERNG